MKRIQFIIFFVGLVFLAASVVLVGLFFNQHPSHSGLSATIKEGVRHSMKIQSSVFANQGMIPAKYTCTGENVNPPLQITGVSPVAKSLVLIVDDPDAPMGVWTHWVVYNIDPSVTAIAEHSVPAGVIEGNTSFGKPGYGGPCPPSGTHHYHFKLYALDVVLLFDHSDQVDKQVVEEKMQGHIIDQAELIGLYSK